MLKIDYQKNKTQKKKLIITTLTVAVAIVSLITYGFMSAGAIPANLIANGSFEDGVIAPATTDYNLITALGHNTMGDPLTYAIGTSPYNYNAAWGNFAAQDGDRMMIVNAATTADKTVWQQEVTVEPGGIYEWSAWVRASYASNPAQLAFSIDGSTIISKVVNNTGAWAEVKGTWTAETSGSSATLRIVDNLYAYSGDDYAIDNLSLTKIGSNFGKATGGIKFMAGTVSVQLDFVAMSDLKNGAKGNVKYSATNGNYFSGKVTGYRQIGNQAYFVGEVSKSNIISWKYFYVAVEDNGEGAQADPDEGVRVLVRATPYSPSESLATGSYDIYTGNVQIH